MATEAPRPNTRASIRHFLEMKREGRPIVAMTAYDVLFGRLLEEAGVDLILVGDSLGPVVLGYDSTVPVTLDEMIHHARAVKRGAPRTVVVLDMPFMTYQTSVEDALRNAGRAFKESGVDAVKLEGGHETTCDAIRALVSAGIPAMGHIGLAPQSVHALGGFGVRGGGEAEAERVKTEALALEEAGAFSMVLERIPAPWSSEISASLTVPTVGIGAGAGCDGEVRILYDALGLDPDLEPASMKRFANLRAAAVEGVRAYAHEVREGRVRDLGHSSEGS